MVVLVFLFTWILVPGWFVLAIFVGDDGSCVGCCCFIFCYKPCDLCVV